MSEMTFRISRWLRAQDCRAVAADMHEIAELIHEVTEPDAPVAMEFRLRSGRIARSYEYDREGVRRELAFRRYARRSGEIVCDADA